MKIWNANELIGKEVYDSTGNAIGWVDKTWNSWNEEYPGYFFGIRTNDYARNTYFRGANKLFPVYNDYIRTVGTTVTLTKTMDDLCRYWNKTVPCGQTTCPVEDLIEMINNFGVLLDPYICETWHLPHNTTFPVEPTHITTAKNTVTLDQALHELKEYWQRTRKY